MTRDDALKLIPPGWVECDVHKYGGSPGKRWKIELDGWFVYAIPAHTADPEQKCRALIAAAKEVTQ